MFGPDLDQEIFNKFRPLCLSLLQNSNPESLAQLKELVREADVQDIEQIQEHIIFPLQVYLKNATQNSNYTLSVIEFIQYFYSKASLQSYFVLKDVLNSLLALASKPSESNRKSEAANEETKVCTMRCLTSMLKSSTSQVSNSFCTEDNKLVMSHLVFLALEWAETERSPMTKSSCISLLETLLTNKSDEFAKVYIQLLPGISSRLVKVCQDPGLVQASIKAAAVRTWTGYVTRLMDDDNMDIDDKFVQAAKIQLEIQFKALQGMVLHSDFRVRESILHCAENLMLKCWTRLDNCHLIILNILIINKENNLNISAIDHAIEMYVKKCDNCLESLCLDVNSILHKINASLEEGLGLLLTEKLQEKLSLLLGYIKFQKMIDSTSSFFISKVHMDKLLQNLVSLAKLQDSAMAISVIEMELVEGKDKFNLCNAIMSQGKLSTIQRPQKSFQHLTTKKLETLFQDLCRCLGKMESRSLVVNYLLDKIRELDYYKREAMLVLNLVVLGAGEEPAVDADNELADLCLPVLEEYLTINACTKVVAMKNDNRKTQDGSEDSWTDFLLAVEGIGFIIKSNKNNFDYQVPEILFHTISNVSSTSSFGSSVLFFMLTDMAVGCGHQFIINMLKDHLDHLTRQVNLSIRQRRVTCPGLEVLLSLVINISYLQGDCAIKHDVLDSVTSLTLNLSLSEADQVLAILNLILVVVTAFKENFKSSTNPPECEIDEGFLTEIIKELELERRKEQEDMRKFEEEISKEGDGDVDMKEQLDQPEEEEPTVAAELSYDKKFLKTCLDHVHHFVSMSGQPSWQLQSLGIISVCLHLLAITPDESPGQRQETFLPLVHQVWSSLHLLFKSTNIFIVDKAFSCLLVIAEHSRDFVHKRVVSDVLPPLVNFFRTMDTLAKDRERNRTLAGRESKRILGNLISGLWDLLYLLDLSPIESDPIIQMIIESLGDQLKTEEVAPYLNPRRNLDINILHIKLAA